MTTGGWQRAVPCMAMPSASRWILCLCRVWGWAQPVPPVLPLIGLSVSVLCYMPALFAKDRTLHLAAARPNPRETLSCLKSGLPGAAPYLYRMVFFLLANHLLLRLEGEKRRGGFAVVQKHRVSDFVHIHRCCQGGAAAVPHLYGEKKPAGGTARPRVCAALGPLCRQHCSGADLPVSGLYLQCLRSARGGAALPWRTGAAAVCPEQYRGRCQHGAAHLLSLDS